MNSVKYGSLMLSAFVCAWLPLQTYAKSYGAKAAPAYKDLEFALDDSNDGDSNKAYHLFSLAMDFAAYSDYAAAEKLYTKAIEIEERKSEGSFSLPLFLCSRGTVFTMDGKYKDAEADLQRSLSLQEKGQGTTDTVLFMVLNDIAVLYLIQGRYAEAERTGLRALDLVKNSKILQHEKVSARCTLAQIYRAQGNSESASPLWNTAITEWKNSCWNTRDLGKLGTLYQGTGKYLEAERLYQAKLDIDKSQSGPGDRAVASDLGHLSTLYLELNQYERAEGLATRALKINEHLYGSKHPHITPNLSTIGIAAKFQGNRDLAKKMYRRALAINEHARGKNSPVVATNLGNMAILYADEHKYAEADQMLSRALEIDKTAFGEKDPHIARILFNKGKLARAENKNEEAEQFYKQSLAIDEQTRRADHPYIATTLTSLANLYCAEGRHAEAEPLYKRAIGIYEATFPKEDPILVQCRKNYAEDLKKLEEQKL